MCTISPCRWEDKKSRLSSGLVKLRQTQEEVATLEEDLQEKALVVKEKAEKADVFAEEIGREKTRVNTEAEKATIEAVKCAQIAEQVAEKKEDCMRDLNLALPLVEQAEAALDVLDKKEPERSALTRPPTDVHSVCETALHLLAGLDSFVEVDKKGRVKDRSWKSVQKMMTDPGRFLQVLKGYKSYIDDGVPIDLSMPWSAFAVFCNPRKDSLGQEFLPENMKKKSQAAGGLSEFVINIIKCSSLRDAAETLEKANERHREVTAMVKDLEEKLARLVAEFDQALAEKDEVMAEAERCQRKLDMAQRLVGALTDNNLQVTRMGSPRMVQVFEQSIEAGHPVLVENMLETVDAVLQPVIARNTLKRGTKREIAYNPNFKLFMQTKLSNPHYPPEIQAECTVINFTVTEQGLEEPRGAHGADAMENDGVEVLADHRDTPWDYLRIHDQLLFLVVKLERPDLARIKSELIQQQNEFKVRLADLEAYLLEKLAGADSDILEDTELVFGLEDAKFTSEEVKEKVKVAQETEGKINLISQNYGPVANRGALLFFLMMELSKMHTFYKYSLDAFVQVVTRAVNQVSLRQVKEKKTETLGITSALKDMDEREERRESAAQLTTPELQGSDVFEGDHVEEDDEVKP
eukprot:g8914.t1